MLRILRNRLRPVPPQPTLPTGYTTGLRTLADDIDAGDTGAIELAYAEELTARDIADYPTSHYRQARIQHFGKPGPGDLPDHTAA